MVNRRPPLKIICLKNLLLCLYSICIYMCVYIYIYIYMYVYICIKYFAWEDQREKGCYIFHKAARWKIKHYVEYIELCGIYSTVMKTILLL